MTEDNDTLISKQFDTLPKALKQIIAELDLGVILDGLRTKYGIHIDQINVISEQIMMTMVGLAGVGSFTDALIKKAGLPSDLANLVTYDLNQQIFSQIREELQKLSSPQQMFDQKMGGVTNVPKQEVEVKAQTGDNKDKEDNSKPPRDPYRESII